MTPSSFQNQYHVGASYTWPHYDSEVQSTCEEMEATPTTTYVHWFWGNMAHKINLKDVDLFLVTINFSATADQHWLFQHKHKFHDSVSGLL